MLIKKKKNTPVLSSISYTSIVSACQQQASLISYLTWRGHFWPDPLINQPSTPDLLPEGPMHCLETYIAQ